MGRARVKTIFHKQSISKKKNFFFFGGWGGGGGGASVSEFF